jgi:fluoroquinolone transport system ATP-binding protein
MDSPDALKLRYGKRRVAVLYQEGQEEKTETFELSDRQALANFLLRVDPIKVHSQEATLEEIFLRVTGKELTA